MKFYQKLFGIYAIIVKAKCKEDAENLWIAKLNTYKKDGK